MKRKILIAALLNIVCIFTSAFIAKPEPPVLVYAFICALTTFPSLVLCAMMRNKNDFAAGILASGGPLLVTGLLFRIMHWPGARIQMILGGCLIVAAIGLLLIQRKPKPTE